MSNVKIPEPVAQVLSCSDIRFLGLQMAPDGAMLITTGQAEAYAAAVRREALEEAAQSIEARIGQHAPGMTPEDVEDCDEEARLCAGVVRALIPQ